MDKNGNPFTVAAGENGKAVLHANGKVYSVLTASVLISIGLIAMSLTVIAQLMLMKQTMADLFVPLR